MLTLIGLSNLSTAQTPNWAWAKSGSGSLNDWGRCMDNDLNGNIFITGNFLSPTITFGTTTLTNASTPGDDAYLVKYDATGNVIWAKSYGGVGGDIAYSVATDANGNVYIAGQFTSDSITFDTITLTNNSNNPLDFFIVKFDNNGNVLWAKNEGVNGKVAAKSVCTDLNGNIFLYGEFNSPSITIGTTTLFNFGNYDVFIVKYDSNGNVLWAKNEGTSTGEFAYGGVCSDINGNVFITGIYSSSINFGTTQLTSLGTSDNFIVKYDQNGNVIWAKSSGGNSQEFPRSICADANGNVIMTGNFQSLTITFDTTIFYNSGAAINFYIAKYDTSGNFLWAHVGNTFDSRSYGVSTDGIGNVIMTGSFNGPTLTFGTTILTNSFSGTNIYVVKYDPSGNLIWAKAEGGNLSDTPLSTCTDSNGNIFITGYFDSSTLNFGTTILTKTGTGIDVFIAKLGTNAVGLNEIKTNSDISIAPNPFTSETTITFSDEQRNTTIKIIDVIGKEIKSISFSGKQLVIDKGEMKPGIYLVQAINENQNAVTKKIVIQ